MARINRFNKNIDQTNADKKGRSPFSAHLMINSLMILGLYVILAKMNGWI